jgi:CelD/BcsL family acetyltransferase involved in cellulose biosynthesis
VLTDPVMKEPVLSAMAKQISALPSWDEWELAELRPGAAGLDMPCPIGCSTQEYASAACPTLHLRPSSGSGGFCTLPKTKQRKLRMAMHRLTRHEAFAIIATPERQAAWWQRELWRLHSARWLTRGQTGVLTDGRSAAFHAEALPLLIDRGIARLYALRIGEEVAGIYYGFSHHTHAYAYLGGFDPAFAYYSPGTVLIGHAIAEAATEGAHTFHFLRGGEAYKYAWGAEDQFNLGRVTSRCAS